MTLDLEPLFDEAGALLGHSCHCRYSELELLDARDTQESLALNHRYGYTHRMVRPAQRALFDTLLDADLRSFAGRGRELIYEPRNKLWHLYWYEPL